MTGCLETVPTIVASSHTYSPVEYYRYLGCSQLRSSGCRGRATIPVGGEPSQLKLTQAHNHPPDLNAEEKVTFTKELRKLVKEMDQSTLKHVYETVAELYPMAAMEIPFRSISSSLHRWRKDKT